MDTREAWLAGWRAHKYGELCEHGYGPGDHHWEQGACLADASEATS